MRCYICDKGLSEAEIQYIPPTKSFEPCATCLEIAMEAAYSGDFKRDEDNETEEEFDFMVDPFVETLEPAENDFAIFEL